MPPQSKGTQKPRWRGVIPLMAHPQKSDSLWLYSWVTEVGPDFVWEELLEGHGAILEAKAPEPQ